MHVPIKEMGRAVDPAAFFADWTYNPSFLIIIKATTQEQQQ